MKIIDADELELDTEWSEYYDGFTSYSQEQIDEAEEVDCYGGYMYFKVKTDVWNAPYGKERED